MFDFVKLMQVLEPLIEKLIEALTKHRESMDNHAAALNNASDNAKK